MSITPVSSDTVIAVTGLALEARIAAGPGVRTIVSAVDPHQLAASLERAIHDGACAIISFGLAGGLTGDIAAGTWLVGRSIVTEGRRWACDPAWSELLLAKLPGARHAEIAGSDHVVMQPDDKRALHERTGVIAVDTESHIAAATAALHGLPFAVFRAVADPASRRLPPAASLAIGHRGRVRVGAVAGSIARKPSQLPALVRTAIDARAAFRALLRGRRLLGLRFGYGYLRKLELDMT